MLGNLTKIEIDKLLHQEVVGRIGCYGDGRVYVIPMTYAYDGQYIYGHSMEGMKITLMRNHPNICFEVDNMKDMTNWKSVIVQGKFQELMGEAARKAMDIFVEQLESNTLSTTGMPMPTHGVRHFHQKSQSSVTSVIFRIEVLEKTGRFERR